MLKNWNPEQIPEKEDIKVRLSAARTRLYELQMALKEHKIPVIVLFEGWGASGKGSTISQEYRSSFLQSCDYVSTYRGRPSETISLPVFQGNPGSGQVYISGFRMDGSDLSRTYG